MKRDTASWSVIALGVVALVGLGVPSADARGRARKATVRSHGSVRQSSARVTRTGAHSANVTRSARVATPHGTKTVTKSTTAHGARPVAHPRAERRDDIRDDVRDAHRRARVRHAVGHAIRTLPRGYTTVYVSGSPYYYYDGVYYVKRHDGGTVTYVVETAPVGAVIYDLPEHSAQVVTSSGTYYAQGTVYYRRAYHNGRVSYVVVDEIWGN